MQNLVLGRRGLGKTTLAVHLAFEMNQHVVAWSPNAQFKMANFRTSSREELTDYLDDLDEERRERELIEYVPDGDLDLDFTLFGTALWPYGDFVLIIDETNELQTYSRINPVLARYIRRAPSREKGDDNPIDIIQTTHFPVDLNRVSFGLSDYAYIFRLTRELDLERIGKELGEEIAEIVKTLRTPQTDPPGRDVIKVDIVTREYEIISDSDSWDMKIKREKPSYLVR